MSFQTKDLRERFSPRPLDPKIYRKRGGRGYPRKNSQGCARSELACVPAGPIVWRGHSLRPSPQGRLCPRSAAACTGSKDVISRPRAFTSGAKDLARSVRGPTTLRARSLTRLNCAEFRDDVITESAAGIGQGQRSHRAWLRFPFRTGKKRLRSR